MRHGQRKLHMPTKGQFVSFCKYLSYKYKKNSIIFKFPSINISGEMDVFVPEIGGKYIYVAGVLQLLSGSKFLHFCVEFF